MARYIDAEKAAARFEACLWGKDYDGVLAKSCIDDTPTADVVEVVRCKECRFFDHSTDFTFCKRVEVGMDEDDYCSFAERRDDAEIH